MTSPDKRHKNPGFPDRRLFRRRRQPTRPAEYFGTSFHFRPRLELMEDRTLLSTFLVNTTADSGAGSLRQAILDSDAATSGTSTIEFAIPGQGVQTITPISPLPAITNAVSIDGFGQPGYAGTPLIELSGSQQGSGDGLTITGAGATVRGLDIDNFSQGAGIHITGTGATGDWIYGNFLGTDPSGTQAEPNNEGVEVDSASADNTIGGTVSGFGNVISGNGSDGVHIIDSGTTGNVVEGNLIGTDVSGSQRLGNAASGVAVFAGASNNVIGGTASGSGNTISANVYYGIYISDTGTTGNVVEGDFIGTDASGTEGLGNGDSGVVIQYGATNNLIGGTTAAARDVISGNGWDGVHIVNGGTTGNVVEGDFIGVTADSSGALGNVASGVAVFDGASDNLIGGTASGASNVISANAIFGVYISDSGTTGNLVEGNDIGTDPAGSLRLGNGYAGVVIQAGAADNTIGGQAIGAGNLITNDGGPGVAVGNSALDASVGNEIIANRIVANSGQAIDLGYDGVTHDSASARQGPNNLQNYPTLVSTADGRLQGGLSGSTPDTRFRIDVFASAGYGPGGAGEAQDYLGALDVTTNSHGEAVFVVPFTAPPGLPVVTATATDPEGNTSEVTALRQATLQSPQHTLRWAPGLTPVFSVAAGEGIILQDVDAGPLDPMWNLTLSVPVGTLTLSSTAGLTGFGDGTARLSYSGLLSTLNAALDGLRFTPPPGFHGATTLSLDAESDRATPFQAQLTLTDGVFIVNTTADSGPGSLREAILESNALTGGTSTIDFAIPGSGIQTMNLVSPLPSITAPVRIDGSSQPGYAGKPLIALGTQSVGSQDGLTVNGSQLIVAGLATDGVALAANDAADDLTFLSAALHPDASGNVENYRIDTAEDGLLIAQVDSPVLTTRLTLLDSQGHALVESDGVSGGDRSGVINQNLPAGTYILEVQSSGVGTYSLTEFLTPASAPFQPVTAGDGPLPVAAGDFNDDGRIDLAVLNTFSYSTGSGSVSVLLGDGDGTFRHAENVATGGFSLQSIVAGDFNGDGKLDLAVAASSGVSLLLGNGDGTFQLPSSFGSLSEPDAMVAGDFNGDGKLDLVVADSGLGLAIFLGDGDGTFQPQITDRAAAGALTIVAGDFNGDGKLDLVVGASGVSVLLGDGDGTFQSPVTYADGRYASAIVAGDFNDDGHVDLAIPGKGAGDATVLMGNGDGTFQQPPSGLGPGSGPASPLFMVAGDFNGDGKLDLIMDNNNSPEVSLLLGNGDGTFHLGENFVTGAKPNGLVADDLNGDGRLDLVAVDGGIYPNNGSVDVLLGNGDGSFQNPAPNIAVPTAGALLPIDVNGDGHIDLAVSALGDIGYGGTDAGGVNVLRGNGDGAFQPALPSPAGTSPSYIMAGDFNGDGRSDLAVVDESSNGNIPNTISILLGIGDGTYRLAEQIAAAGALTIAAGDFNGDGKLDLAVANGTNDVRTLLGNGDGTFQSAVDHPVDGVSHAILAEDFNGDGKLDLAVVTVASDGQAEVSVLLGNADGTFRPAETYDTEGFAYFSILGGDFNGDGKLDLAVAGYIDNTSVVWILKGRGDGTFRPAEAVAIGGFPLQTIVAGDLNGDGKLDLAALASPDDISDEVAVLLGNDNGTFEPPTLYPVGTSNLGVGPQSLATGDFNGDGHPDLAVAVGFFGVSILLGRGDGRFVDPSELVTDPRFTPVVADVNIDGADDVLVVDGAGDILYRQGIAGQPGSFEPPVIVNPNNPSRDVAWLPNTDQGPVLASVDAHENAISFYAYRDGGFVRLSGSLTTGQLPAQIIAADLSGDGWTDLVVRNAGDGTLSVYFGTSLASIQFVGPVSSLDPPTFLPPATLRADVGISDVQTLDTIGSDRLDLVVTNKLSGQISVLKNLGNGTFAPPAPYRAGTGLSEIDAAGSPEVTSLEATAGVAAGPLTPGGPADLVTINPGSNTMDVLAGLGQSRFANAIAIQTASPAQVVRMGDFTGNGIDDLAVLTANGLSIYLGNGHEGFLPPTTYAVPPEADGLTVADLLGDGKLDLLVGDAYGDVLVLLGNGDGTFQPYHEANQAVELAVADLAGNGSKDIIYADRGLDRVVVDYGAGNSTVLANQSTGLLDPGAVKLADMNGDGIPDLIVANSGSNNVLIYPGLGNSQFGPAVNGGNGYFVGTNPAGITVADVTGTVWPSGEPRLDLVVADSGSNDVAILLNQGNFRFNPGPRLNSDGAGPVSTVVGFFTGGTAQDILVTNSGSNNVTLLQGVGGGFFKPATSYSVGNDPVQSFVGNFDGKLDLLTDNAGSNDLTLISDFNGPNPVTTTISSGGLDPETAFAFESTSGFEDLVVGNTGDGVLALFEGGSGGLTLMSAQTEPSLPSPTDLAFATVTGGQVEFYAATAGHEAATLVALSLSGETLAQTQSDTSLATVSNVAQLVPLNESSLALVASLLTVTISTTEGELNVESAQTEAAASLASLPGASATLGQGLFRQFGHDPAGGDEADDVGQSADAASPGVSASSPWERFMLGLDQALEQFRREFQSRISGQQNQAADRDQPKPQPPPNRSAPDAPTSFRSTPGPLPNNPGQERFESTQPADRGEAVDASIDSIWGEEAQRVLPLRLRPEAPIRLVVADDGCEHSERGPSRFSALERRLHGSFEPLANPGLAEPAEFSLRLVAATLLLGCAPVARPRREQLSFTANFSPLARRGRLTRNSRAARA